MFLQIGKPIVVYLREELKKDVILNPVTFLCYSTSFSPLLGILQIRSKAVNVIYMGVKQCSVTAFSVFFPMGICSNVRPERKRRLDPLILNPVQCDRWRILLERFLSVLSIFNKSPVSTLQKKKKNTHRLLSSAALFYSGFYCVILIRPRPVTHTVQC